MNLTDEEGLKKAYDSPNSNYINGDTLYIAGTHTLSDVMTDLTIPIHALHMTTRYKQSEKILNENKNIKNIVGHSLGSAILTVLKEKNENKYSNVKGRAYGSPTILPHKDIKYFRHPGDPVSIVNVFSGATDEHYLNNPHSYAGYDEDFTSDIIQL